jgi:hypothetical protein
MLWWNLSSTGSTPTCGWLFPSRFARSERR